MNPVLRIIWFYPDILNLQGDRGNVMALERVCRTAGIEPQVVRVNRLEDEFSLDGAGVVLLGPGELAVMPAVLEALGPRHDEFAALVDQGALMLVSGTSAALVARQTRRVDGTVIPGLGLLDLDVSERETIIGDDLILKVGPQELHGMQIRLTDLKLVEGTSTEVFGEIVYGFGNDSAHPGVEGARRRNLIATNLLGPLLVKNPWFTWTLVNELVVGPDHNTPSPTWPMEERAAHAQRSFCASKPVAQGTVRTL